MFYRVALVALLLLLMLASVAIPHIEPGTLTNSEPVQQTVHTTYQGQPLGHPFYYPEITLTGSLNLFLHRVS
jgi:hypothetical protein